MDWLEVLKSSIHFVHCGYLHHFQLGEIDLTYGHSISQHNSEVTAQPRLPAGLTVICLIGMKSALWRTRSKILASCGFMKASSENDQTQEGNVSQYSHQKP